jgi:hypothetical protein
MSTARWGHTATLLPDGWVLVSGGFSPGYVSLASAEIYDPALGTWSLTGSMSTARWIHTATLLPDGRVLVSGGSDDIAGGGGGALASAEIFDTAPPVTTVEIDINPGSDPKNINPRSKGVISVAILTTDTFNASTVAPSTVRFGASGTEAGPVHSALEDVDGDGDTDMILHFNTKATGIQCGDTAASLTGETLDGQMIQGSDAIRTVGCK